MSYQRDNYTTTQVRAFVPEITFNLNNGEAMDLLIYDPAAQSFQINEEAMEHLIQCGGNVGFIFNIGQKTVGKSYLINHVMDLNVGYRAFTEKTKGIKLWNKPLFREEENLHLFFVDVQGFDNDANFRNFVWLLSFVLGSIVLYSTSGPVNDKTFDELGALKFVSEKLILSEHQIENDYLLSYYSPKLIWLLKDFPASEADAKNFTIEKYMEGVLREINRDQSKNPLSTQAKTFIINTFKDRIYLNFPAPQGTAKFNEPVANLGANYVQQLKLLKEKIYSRATNKYFDGITFSAKMMVHLIACIVGIFNKDKTSPILYSEM